MIMELSFEIGITHIGDRFVGSKRAKITGTILGPTRLQFISELRFPELSHWRYCFVFVHQDEILKVPGTLVRSEALRNGISYEARLLVGAHEKQRICRLLNLLLRERNPQFEKMDSTYSSNHRCTRAGGKIWMH
jgi:hypothetical protein